MLSGHGTSDDYSEGHFPQQPEALSGRKEVAGRLVEHEARKVQLFHYLCTQLVKILFRHYIMFLRENISLGGGWLLHT